MNFSLLIVFMEPCIIYCCCLPMVLHGQLGCLTRKQWIMQNLYYYNVRKVVVMGLAPLGCTPFYSSKRENRECVKEINNMIMEFNFLMRYMVNKLSQELPDAKITFCDAYEGSIDIINNRKKYGQIGMHFLSVS